MHVPTPLRRLLDEALLALTYFAFAAVPMIVLRMGGGSTFVWVATPLLFARLSLLPFDRWRGALIACGIANAVAIAWFGAGITAAVPVTLVSVAEAALAAWTLRHWLGSSAYFEAPLNVGAFALIAGVIVPAIFATAVAISIAGATGRSMWYVWMTMMLAHGLGTIVFAPILMLVMRGESRAWFAGAPRRQRFEAAALLALVTATTVGVFTQATVPLLFLPLLPITGATLRFGRLGAAAAIVMLAVIGGALTLAGGGPILLLHGGTGARLQFFQLYLACATMLVLPVAALLKQNTDLLTRLSDSEARYRVLAERSSDAILNVGIDGTIRYASPAVAQLAGFTPAALTGRNAIELVFADDVARVAETHRRALGHPASGFTVEYRATTAAGALRWFETSTRAVVDAAGHITGVVSAIRDVTARKATEERLATAANTDALTGLPNRRAFAEALEERLRAVRTDGVRAALAMFDIDWFKTVNDRHGHAAGDAVLVAFAQTARRALRDGDCLARIGGEEFGLVLSASGADEAEMVCERLRRLLSATPVRLDGGASVHITVSAGVAPLGADDDAAAVLRAADAALYRAKATGRDRLVLAA